MVHLRRLRAGFPVAYIRRPMGVIAFAFALSALLATGPVAAGTKFQTLFQFAGPDAPRGLQGQALAVSPGGTFYGAASGPSDENGVIYSLSPDPKHKGEWIYAPIHAFAGGPNDGTAPTGVIRDAHGVLYGTTTGGGHTGTYCFNGCGTVFKIAPPPKGKSQWSESVIHFFEAGKNGNLPATNLVFDKEGQLFGTTAQGGSTTCSTPGCGTLFRLTRPKSGNGLWVSKSQTFNGANGNEPVGVSIDRDGNLYAAAMLGGTRSTASGVAPDGAGTGSGTVDEVADKIARGNELMRQAVIWTSAFADAGLAHYPAAPATPPTAPVPGGGEADPRVSKATPASAATLLIGTATGGGLAKECPQFDNNGCGVVYALSKGSNGKWTMRDLYAFKNLGDGAAPYGTLVQDKAGNIYGTTSGGGTISAKCGAFGCGTVFELSPPKSGKGEWRKVFTFKFKADKDGNLPAPNLTLYNGAVYGVASAGGDLAGCNGFGCGTFFKITP